MSDGNEKNPESSPAAQEKPEQVQQNDPTPDSPPVFPNQVTGPPNPLFPLAHLPENTETVRHRSENHEDRRGMRKWLFRFVVFASASFLVIGAVMSICITKNMLKTKHEVKTAMLDVIKESSPQKISEFVAKAQPTPPESLYHARETAKVLNAQAVDQRNGLISKFLETTNWLSLTPMITLIAFMLGVGLTLAIALMKALFREEESEEKNNTLSHIATPISKLLEYLVDYLQSKFKGK